MSWKFYNPLAERANALRVERWTPLWWPGWPASEDGLDGEVVSEAIARAGERGGRIPDWRLEVTTDG